MSTEKKEVFRQYISLCADHYRRFDTKHYQLTHEADHSSCAFCGRAAAQYSFMPKYMLARQRQRSAPVRSRDTRAQYKGDWRESMYGNNNDNSSERPEEDALPY